MSFPVSTPSYQGFIPTNTLAIDNHAAQHNQEQADIIALANKIGLGASTPIGNTLLRGSSNGNSSWSQIQLPTDVEGILSTQNGGTGTSYTTGSGSLVLNDNPSLISPNISNGGQWSGSPTIAGPILTNQPAITDFTNANHNHQNAVGGGILNASSALQAASITANLLGSDSSWYWSSFSPSWTNLNVGTGGQAANSGAFTEIGKTIIVRTNTTLGSSGESVGTGPYIAFPVNPQTVYNALTIIGTIWVQIGPGQNFIGFVATGLQSGPTPVAIESSSGSLGEFTSTVPGTFTAGSNIQMQFMYEAA